VNLWGYLAASPSGAAALVFIVGWTLVRFVRAWRDRRPVTVQVVMLCPDCTAERWYETRDGEVRT
jgi:hypothetical protein